MSLRRTVHSVTMLLLGVYLGANLSHFHALHNAMMYDNNQTNLTLLRPLTIESRQRRQGKVNESSESETNPIIHHHHQASRKLEQCQSLLQQTEQLLQVCRNNAAATTRQQDTADQASTAPNDSYGLVMTSGMLNMEATASMAQHPVCRHVLPHPSPNAMAIWSSQLARIHKASQLPNDRKYGLSDFTAELLHLISNRLPRAVKTVPHRWDAVERVLDVGYKRWKYLNEMSKRRKKLPKVEDANAPRKVNILIMGGSLLVGTNCRKIISDLGIPDINLPNRHCTWSNRLEKFLNQLFGPILGVYKKSSRDYESIWDLVQVTKTAMGGTNTQTGQVILEYDLLPAEARHPDIIINAYSTNDMHILTVLDAAQGNVTLRDKVFDMTQEFVRQVLQRRSPPCNGDDDVDDKENQGEGGRRRRRHAVPPLLFHMDDYLGNEQREIWSTTELSQGVQVLANYYGFTSMSYADVVRDLVYADTHESWFSPSGWYDATASPGSKESKIMSREIHPGMGMHISATWVTVYTMLHLVTTFCSLEWSQTGNSTLAPWQDDTQPLSYDRRLALPPLEGRFTVPGKPQRPPRDLLPPPLDKHLSLENITELWRQQSLPSQDMAWSSASSSCDKQRAVRCPFSWVSSLNQQQKNVTYVREYFGQRMASNEGWNLITDHGKLGYVPVGGRNSSLTLEFLDLTQPIRTVTLFIMKSYGPRWAGSRLNVAVVQGETKLLTHTLEGFHDKHTSETYAESLQLERTILPLKPFRLLMELVDGETFKLMGVAVCS